MSFSNSESYLREYRVYLAIVLICISPAVLAGGIQALDLGSMDVTGENQGLIGHPIASSVGTVTSGQIENRPLLRPGELLEVTPGLIVTQHSGAGKANQYFLRGFNLDHGTDMAGYVNGVPINMPTHAHGQGYLDLNWLIPELVQKMQYKKGPYYAEEGDFSSAGVIRLDYFKSLPESIYKIDSDRFLNCINIYITTDFFQLVYCCRSFIFYMCQMNFLKRFVQLE